MTKRGGIFSFQKGNSRWPCTVRYIERDSTGGSTDLTPQRTGAESDIYVRSAFLFMHMLRMVMTRSFSGGVAMYFRYCG